MQNRLTPIFVKISALLVRMLKGVVWRHLFMEYRRRVGSDCNR